MTRLLTALLLLPGFLFAAPSPKPNVLFICVDDLVPVLGCYGDTVAKTPQIDLLAAQGMVFRNHHCPWPVCGPSRAALVTSLMPEETNVLGFRKIRDKNYLPNVVTLPQHFRNHGYDTACSGKFHDPRTVGTTVPVSTTYPDGVMDNGQSVDDPQAWSVPFVQATGGYDPPTHTLVDNNATEPVENYVDHIILTRGRNLIDDLNTPGGQAAGDKPFFLAVGFKKPHLPLVAPKTYWDLHDRAAMPLAQFTALPTGVTGYNASGLTNNSEILGGTTDPDDGYLPYSATGLLPDTAQQREIIHAYYACVSFVDNLVGQLRAKLATTDDPRQPGKKLSETTIVVLWGDHGFHLGDHSKWAKHTIMEKSTSSPLIIYDPRLPMTAHSTTKPVGTTDIYPTLCELAALPVPQQPSTSSGTRGRPLRGRSLVPLLKDASHAVHHGVITQFSTSGQYGYAYRTERFRYIEWISASGNMNDGNARRDLYDYETDPNETRNLADDPAYAGIVYQLSRSLRAETTVRGTGRLNVAAPIPTGGAAFLPAQLNDAPPGQLKLAWPASGGVTYRVDGSSQLTAESWSTLWNNLAGPTHQLAMTEQRQFFLIGFGTDTPPRWLSDTVTKPMAIAGSPYTGSLAADVTDPGDTLTFTKLSGPSWLSVAANGALSGTPTACGVDVAEHFRVQVADASGIAAAANLQITTGDPAVNAAPVFTSDPIVKDPVTAGSSYTGSLITDASDANPSQVLTFSLVSAPTWLSVSAEGILSGTPGLGNSGVNLFTVRVTDPLGAFDDTQLSITVGSVAGITVIDQKEVFGAGNNYATTWFPAVELQAGDVLVVAHAPNKNTTTNTITMTMNRLSGPAGTNAVTTLSAGSTGTTAAAWIFTSIITAGGTFDLTLDTNNGTKTVTQATSMFVLRNPAGALQVAASDVSLAPASAPVPSLSLDFTFSPAVTDAYGILASAMNTSTFNGTPTNWTAEANSATKRQTFSRANISGGTLTVPFAGAATSDMALAGIIISTVP